MTRSVMQRDTSVHTSSEIPSVPILGSRYINSAKTSGQLINKDNKRDSVQTSLYSPARAQICHAYASAKQFFHRAYPCVVFAQFPKKRLRLTSKRQEPESDLESDKCTCGSAQTTKHLWESCTKSQLRRLHDTEPNLTKILQDKDKDNKEFQLLVKEMERRPRDEEYQSKSRNAGNRSAR
ncbi:hypothetical protein HN011_002237 [Eciton burchellii]|nr:hypothetical protein HN011_002237 [Eciton burchellii]